jgi:uncharacterized protein (TIGR02145 family)
VDIEGIPIVKEQGIILTPNPEATYYTDRIQDTSSLEQISKTFSVSLEGGLTYYVRPFIVTQDDTVLGKIRSFKTGNYFEEGNGVIDNDGNQYETVIIGNQEWMAENLRSQTFCNNDTIPIVDSIPQTSTFIDSTSQVVLNYHFDDNENMLRYGYYYAGYTIMDARNICPCGWRIPKTDDIEELLNYLGNDKYVGGKMKTKGILENGTGNWKHPNALANNLSGFSAEPGGHYSFGSNYFYDLNETAAFAYIGEATGWNTPFEEDPKRFELDYNRPDMNWEHWTISRTGHFVSIRCIKN